MRGAEEIGSVVFTVSLEASGGMVGMIEKNVFMNSGTSSMENKTEREGRMYKGVESDCMC